MIWRASIIKHQLSKWSANDQNQSLQKKKRAFLIWSEDVVNYFLTAFFNAGRKGGSPWQ